MKTDPPTDRRTSRDRFDVWLSLVGQYIAKPIVDSVRFVVMVIRQNHRRMRSQRKLVHRDRQIARRHRSSIKRRIPRQSR